MKVEHHEPCQDALCGSLGGAIKQSNIPSGSDPLRERFGADLYARRLILSLEGGGYIDTSGICWLIDRHHDFERHGGRLVLHSVPPSIEGPLKLLNMHKIFRIASDRGQAEKLLTS